MHYAKQTSLRGGEREREKERERDRERDRVGEIHGGRIGN